MQGMNMEQVSESQQRSKLSVPAILGVVVILLLLLLAEPLLYGSYFSGETPYPDAVRGVVDTDLKSLKAFHLIDQENKQFGLEQLAGGWTFVFFGYTHCPDICPATLSQLTLLNHSIQEKDAAEILPKFLFVSVDPARDKVNVLHDYINYFDDSFMAATGDMSDIKAFEKQFSVTHRYGEPDANKNYTVTHNAGIFLVDPEARIVAKFMPPISVQRVTQQYGVLVDYFQSEKTHI